MAKRRKRQANPGAELRAMRQQLGLSSRDVYAASLDIAEQCRQPAFEIPPSGLHNIESKNMIPSIHRLHALALIYRRRSEEHTSELQSHSDLVCRLLLEKKYYIQT